MSVVTIGATDFDCCDPNEAPLSEAQRGLVERNLHLVGIHISRRVANAVDGRVDRDYGDLFQEGCFGLMRAARDYDPEQCPSFEAYALKRIHRAVTAAIRQNSSPVKMSRRAHQERRLTRGRCETGMASETYCPDNLVDVREVEDDREVCTVGDRVRFVCERALDWAAKLVIRSCRRGDDIQPLVERLVEERFRIPEPSEKTPLRQIAREMGLQSAQVLRCERRLQSEVQGILSGDLELRWLLELAAEQEAGYDYAVNEEMVLTLERLASQTFVDRVRRATHVHQEQMMVRMFYTFGSKVWSQIGRMYGSMSAEHKDSLMESLLMDTERTAYSEVA